MYDKINGTRVFFNGKDDLYHVNIWIVIDFMKAEVKSEHFDVRSHLCWVQELKC